MPDPISSSYVPPDLNCHDADSLACEPAVALPPEGPNTCVGPEHQPQTLLPDGASQLVAKFQRVDNTAYIESSVASAHPVAPQSSAAIASNSKDQVTLHGGLPRLHEEHGNLGPIHMSSSIDALSAYANLGSQNDDGSKGENIGLGVTYLGAEATAEYSGWSLTLGVSSSLGGSISSGGGRDVDGDGAVERCFKLSLGPFTMGECDEL